ncbi:putative teichuronic acid biosynthesis glycosyltransferase TuaH [Abditibacteriota bacterium]|nr:putative teichuronic acid biosynthesis glycosyltransferase TuaH [Abditibacteriota bacterium]
MSTSSCPIIAHSHLGWEFVWQRPQQILSRLSRRHPVLFVDALRLDPQAREASFRLERVPEFPCVTLLKMTFPSARFSDGAYVDATREKLLRVALQGPLWGQFERPIQWFYDPMAAFAFAGKFDERAIVYDCMDELSAFKYAQPELVRRERELLADADLVFVGGRRLWAAKRRFNPNCHFFGCGVDVEHFGTARDHKKLEAHDLALIPHPRLGYFGVIDERLDLELLEKLADFDPGWHIVMIGPLAKIADSDLPRRPNIHYLGARDYARLPDYVRGFDVCLMPFARNEATEHINPTKALEYLATATPVVSTDVPDVVAGFRDVIGIAASQEEFVQKCHAALQNPDAEVIARGLGMAQANTWESVVAQLEAHLDSLVSSRH